jgi:hypothetical protein
MKRSIERAVRRAAARSQGLAFAAVAVAALAATDCTRDHDALAARPRPEGGTAGRGGSAGASSGFGGTGGTGGRAGSGGTGGTGGGKVMEPLGRSVITFLHALADANAVALCFAKNDGGGNELLGRPRPAAGLTYGGALVLEALSGVDLDAERVVPFAITGELALLDGLTCDDAVPLAEAEMRAASAGGGGTGGSAPNDAGTAGEAGDGAGGVPSATGGTGGASSPVPARLRVARLPELAPGTLTEGHSLLYAVVGCLGGPAYTHEDEAALCGAGYAPDRPTVSAELVVLSRKVGISTIGIQALHASRSLSTLNLRARPPESAVEPWAYIADGMTEGMLRPRDPRLDLNAAGYGIGTRTWRVQALVDGTPVVSDSWMTVLGRAGLAEPAIGRTYTLVVMGPSEKLDAPLWNPPGFTIVDNDPEP